MRASRRQLLLEASRAAPACAWDCRCRYSLDVGRFVERVRGRVRQSAPDDAARVFVERSRQVGFLRVCAALALRWVMSTTDANALCGTGEMHIFSTEQAAQWILGQPSDTTCTRLSSLLDVGAGDGAITARLAPLFESVTTTEVSEPMVARLQSLGYECVPTCDPRSLVKDGALRRFSCISLLNVLDRCDEPLTLLTTLRDMLNDDGCLILAVVLPFKPGVEDGTGWRQPRQSLPGDVHDGTIEIAANALVVDVLEPMGYEVDVITRLPYMSFSISLAHDVAFLNNVIFICRRAIQR
ncbi:unnamed protein product (mitochondrion) [Plasmodiophora brassicae]|uniref:Methyltransferase type 11 domain-containing protein n=1 Tax=Plasmodiophora brassicae TaxID=37360 RepID=A0A0G4IR80_PLABS|nr:hypothetical protein PBRA_005889 [Plasmodiophora brassicae]SPQ98322.1 unnamed protein product [Plasmodiophora brassicae]